MAKELRITRGDVDNTRIALARVLHDHHEVSPAAVGELAGEIEWRAGGRLGVHATAEMDTFSFKTADPREKLRWRARRRAIAVFESISPTPSPRTLESDFDILYQRLGVRKPTAFDPQPDTESANNPALSTYGPAMDLMKYAEPIVTFLLNTRNSLKDSIKVGWAHTFSGLKKLKKEKDERVWITPEMAREDMVKALTAQYVYHKPWYAFDLLRLIRDIGNSVSSPEALESLYNRSTVRVIPDATACVVSAVKQGNLSNRGGKKIIHKEILPQYRRAIRDMGIAPEEHRPLLG